MAREAAIASLHAPSHVPIYRARSLSSVSHARWKEQSSCFVEGETTSATQAGHAGRRNLFSSVCDGSDWATIVALWLRGTSRVWFTYIKGVATSEPSVEHMTPHPLEQ